MSHLNSSNIFMIKSSALEKGYQSDLGWFPISGKKNQMSSLMEILLLLKTWLKYECLLLRYFNQSKREMKTLETSITYLWMIIFK